VGEGADPEFPLRSLEEATGCPIPVAGSRTSPPGVGLPSRVVTEPGERASGCPRPPLPSARERAGLRVLSRSGYPTLRRAPGPLMGFGSPTGFPTSRSGRPVSGPTPPMGFFAPTTTAAHRSGSPGLTSPGTFRPQGSTLSPVYSLRTTPIRRSDAARGVHPSGLDTFRPAAPVSRPWSSCRFRFSLPSPLRTRRSGAPPRLQDVTPVRRPFPSGRSCLPSGPRPSWVLRPLRSSRPVAMVPASRNLPSCASPSEAAEAADDAGTPGCHSRRGQVNSLLSPPAPLRSAASPVRSRFRRCWFEPR